MPPIIPDKIPCESVQQLEQEFSTLQDALSLEETEETWDRIERALIRFSAVVKGGGYKYEKELVSRIKTSNKPIIHAMNSERTRLSAAALDCIVVIAPRLGLGFEALVPLFVPHILRLSTRTNKVYVTRSQAGVALIIGYCHIPSIMPHLLAACKDSKIVTGRAVAVEGMLRCLNKWDWTQKDIKAKVSDVEEVIKVTGRDKDAAIRQTSRKVFEAYKTLFPERIDEFIAPLTPVMRKYLDIKPGAKSGPPSKLKLSSSTSAVPSVPSTNARSNPGKHVRSVSSNAVATGSATLTGLKPHPSAPIPTHFMPPPAAIPSRGRSTSRTQVNSQTRPGSEHPLPEREDDQERRRVLSSASSNFSVKSAPANSYPTMEHRPPVRMTASQSHSREGKPPMSVTSGQARRVPRVVSVEPHPANRPDLLALAHKPPVRPMPPRAKTPISNRGPGREPTQSAPIGALGITFPSSEAGSAPILRKGAQRVPKPAPPPVPTKAEKSTTANNHSSNREAKPSIFRRGAPAPGETKNGEKEGEKPKEGYVPRRGGGVTQPTLSQLSKQRAPASASGSVIPTRGRVLSTSATSKRPIWGAGAGAGPKPTAAKGTAASRSVSRTGIRMVPKSSEQVIAPSIEQVLAPIPGTPGTERKAVPPHLVPLPMSPEESRIAGEQPREATPSNAEEETEALDDPIISEETETVEEAEVTEETEVAEEETEVAHSSTPSEPYSNEITEDAQDGVEDSQDEGEDTATTDPCTPPFPPTDEGSEEDELEDIEFTTGDAYDPTGVPIKTPRKIMSAMKGAMSPERTPLGQVVLNG